MKCNFWRLTKRIAYAVLGSSLILLSSNAATVKVMAQSAEEMAYQMAGQAANQAYEAAKAAGKSEEEARAAAQAASETTLPYALSMYKSAEEQNKLNEAANKELQKTLDAQREADEALQKQMNTAFSQQSKAMDELMQSVEALGKEEEEEKSNIKVAETRVASENPCVTWYVKGINKKIKQSEAFIGTRVITISEQGMLGDGDGPAPKTLLLVDNSNSISKYKDKISTILTRLVWNHQPRERFSLVVFGETSKTLLDYTDNYDDVRLAISKMTYYDQSTYLRNVLYDEIKAMIDDGEDDFNRIIIVSDGTEESRLGVTYEELTDLVESDAYSCPIYTIGCSYKPAVGDLDKLFALSRRTSSPFFALDDYKDANLIADLIREDDREIRYFRFSIPDDLRDGADKSIGLHVVYEEGEDMFAHTTTVPITSAEALKKIAAQNAAQDKKEDTKEIAVSAEASSIAFTDESVEDDEDEEYDPEDPLNKSWLYYYGEGELSWGELALYYILNNGLWVTLVLLIVYFAYISFHGRQKKKIKSFEQEQQLQEEKKEILKSNINTAIYLYESSSPDVRYEIRIGEEKTLGRSRARCDIAFPGDRAMSSRQASIRVEDGDEIKAVLENLDTQGGTKVDDETVINDIVLRNGARIKIGTTLLEVRYG